MFPYRHPLPVDYTDSGGKRHYESFTAETRKEAEFLAAQFALTKKERWRSDKTFGQALDDYISERQNVLSPRTIRDYKYIRNNEIQSLMQIKIKDITQKILQEIINEDVKTHSPKTVRNHHGLISAVLKQERLDFALNTVIVHVKRNMVLNDLGKWVIKSPKTYAGDRYIDFPGFVAEKLECNTKYNT